MYNTVSVIFFATRCYASAAYAVMRCPSVCLSVHLSRSWILSKRINISSVFSPLGSHIILVFPHQTSWQYSYGTAPNGGVECRWGRQKSRFSANIWLRCMLWKQPARCYEHGAAEPQQVVTLTAGSKRRSSLMAGDDDDEIFITRSLNITPNTAEQHLIAHSDKSVAHVTNNKRLCSTFCTIEANYWQTQSIAWPLCDSRATCTRLCNHHSWQMHSCTAKWSTVSIECIDIISWEGRQKYRSAHSTLLCSTGFSHSGRLGFISDKWRPVTSVASLAAELTYVVTLQLLWFDETVIAPLCDGTAHTPSANNKLCSLCAPWYLRLLPNTSVCTVPADVFLQETNKIQKSISSISISLKHMPFNHI